MRLSRKILKAATLAVLALPFMITGNSDAVKFSPDGAVQNATTGVYELPPIACYGVSDAWIAGGAANANPGTALALPGVPATKTDCAVAAPMAYITYFKEDTVNCPGEATTGTCCNAAGFSWRSGGTRGCYARNVKIVGESAAGLNGNNPEYRTCLKCHNSTFFPANPEYYEPANYIYSSHRNASRKITPGKNWAQIHRDASDNEVFGVFSKVNGTVGGEMTIDWLTGKLTPTVGAPIPWFWYWGYFFEDPRDGSDIVADEITTTAGGGIPTRNMSSCALCHATGFSAENSVLATKEPAKTWGTSIVWDGSTTYTSASNTVNLKNQYNRFNELNGGSTVPSSGDCTILGGTIVSGACVRTDLSESACRAGGGSIPGGTWTGAWTGAWTATGTKCTITLAWKSNSWDEFGVLCSNCHNAVDGGHNNSGPRQNVPRPTAAQPAKGAQVNAVCLQCHAKASSGNGVFTAPSDANLAASAYITTGHPNYHGSQFMNSPHARYNGTYAAVNDTTKYSSAFATTYGGCEGCHNPHGSVRENLLDPILMGAVVAEEGIKTSCASCHTAYSDADTIAITDISHPTGTGTPMGAANAPTDGCVICHMPGNGHLFRIAADNVTPKADGAYTDAAWVPLTGGTASRTACQQCHGSVAFAMTADQAKAAAKNMHGGITAVTNNDCLTCHGTGNAVGAPVIAPGVNHHDGTCTDCHFVGASDGRAPHDDVAPLSTAEACNACHTSKQQALINHPNKPSLGTPDCSGCHSAGGFRPTALVCNGCHGGSDGPGAVSGLAPFLSAPKLQKILKAGMHRNVAPVASMTVDGDGLTATVHDSSSDVDGNIVTIVIDWGDKSRTSISAGDSASHTYAKKGKKTITLTVTDSRGVRSTTKIKIAIPYSI